MPIKNYTTNVDVFTTIASIQSSLVKHGAKKNCYRLRRQGTHNRHMLSH